MNKLLAIGLLLATTTLPATAGSVLNGDELLKQCTSENYQELHCLGYLRGLADGLTLWEFDRSNSAYVCIPETVNTRQLQNRAVKWLQDNAKRRHEDAGTLIGLAFYETWPCVNDEKKP